jgi:DNA-binding GntR family transcriptional regulator
MPVPVPQTESPAPRRLLRDVVFEKMLAAIADGTLELGERLNDDELVRWLGVSRTPVREAIAKLADFGLVDIEANRYTRIISPTVDDFADTTLTAFDVWGVVALRGIPQLSTAEAQEVASLLGKVKRSASGEIRADAIANFASAMSLVARASKSPSVLRLLETVSDRAALLLGLTTREVAFSLAPALLSGLADAVAARDGRAGAATLADAREALAGYIDEVGAAGVFPARRSL